jgi:hypothetical protein
MANPQASMGKYGFGDGEMFFFCSRRVKRDHTVFQQLDSASSRAGSPLPLRRPHGKQHMDWSETVRKAAMLAKADSAVALPN